MCVAVTKGRLIYFFLWGEEIHVILGCLSLDIFGFVSLDCLMSASLPLLNRLLQEQEHFLANFMLFKENFANNLPPPTSFHWSKTANKHAGTECILPVNNIKVKKKIRNTANEEQRFHLTNAHLSLLGAMMLWDNQNLRAPYQSTRNIFFASVTCRIRMS